jgi:hypothetical protein
MMRTVVSMIAAGVVFALTFGAILAGYYTVGPMVETQFFPVTTKVTILDQQPVEGGIQFRFSGDYGFDKPVRLVEHRENDCRSA